MAGDDDNFWHFDWLFYGNKPKRKDPAWERDQKLSKKEEKDLQTGKLSSVGEKVIFYDNIIMRDALPFFEVTETDGNGRRRRWLVVFLHSKTQTEGARLGKRQNKNHQEEGGGGLSDR